MRRFNFRRTALAAGICLAAAGILHLLFCPPSIPWMRESGGRESAAGIISAPLMMVGEAEMVRLEGMPDPFPARIDTGAAMCSLDASDLAYTDHDGERWVSFTVRHRTTGRAHTYTRRLLRIVSIKSVGTTYQRRPVVEMSLRLGSSEAVREVNLNDRSNYEYQVLVGRNFLSGTAAVNPARAFILPQEGISGNSGE